MQHRTLVLALALLGVSLTAQAAPPSAPRPRLAFLELSTGQSVERGTASTAGDLLVVALSETGKFDVITQADIRSILGYEAQAQLLGCSEASCMVDLGGALGAAYLVSGSLGKLGNQLQLVLALIDVNQATVHRRVAVPVAGENALPGALKSAVQKLTGELMPDAGPIDACTSPPCAKEALATARRWWETTWDALTIIGIVPDGPFEQRMVDGKPSRIFRFLVRTRSRDGRRGEYVAYIRYQRVEGDWFFDQGSINRLRGLPIKGDEPPAEAALQKLLIEGFQASHPGTAVDKLLPARFPDYETGTKENPDPTWEYTYDVTYKHEGKTKNCPKMRAKLVKATKDWEYRHASDGYRCEVVLDAE